MQDGNVNSTVQCPRTLPAIRATYADAVGAFEISAATTEIYRIKWDSAERHERLVCPFGRLDWKSLKIKLNRRLLSRQAKPPANAAVRRIRQD